MASTTNYNWTTPDDVGLVKDGASAIRTLGSAIDTTTKNLNPETTLGDIAYRSSTANTNTRLALGTAGQVLTVNSGATAPEWQTPNTAMTLLSTTSLSGATTTISSISGSYTHLFAYIYGVTNATADGTFRVDPNGSSTISTIARLDVNTSGFQWSQDTRINLNSNGYNVARAQSNNGWILWIYNYASTANWKAIQASGVYLTDATNDSPVILSGGIQTASAISSLVFSNSGGNLSTGTVLLYGVK